MRIGIGHVVGGGLLFFVVLAALMPQPPSTAVIAKDSGQELEGKTADLLSTKRQIGESVDVFNRRVTEAYNQWVAAELNQNGDNWREKYIEAHRTPQIDCSQFYGSLIHEDDVIRMARAACAAQGTPPEPTVPALADFLIQSPAGGPSTSDSNVENSATPSAPGD